MTNVIKLETTLLRRGYTVAELRAAVAKIAAAYAAALAAADLVEQTSRECSEAYHERNAASWHADYYSRRGRDANSDADRLYYVARYRSLGRMALRARLADNLADNSRMAAANAYYALCQKVQRQSLLLGEYAIEVGGGYL